MSEILTKEEVEQIADDLLRRFLDSDVEKRGSVTFDFFNLNNRYVVVYQKNHQGFWRLYEYDRYEK